MSYDPAKPALDLIKQVGIYGLCYSDGCPCTNFEVHGVSVDVSCHKSDHCIRVYSCSADFQDAEYKVRTCLFQPIADEVRRQVNAYYCNDQECTEYGDGYAVKFLSWDDEHKKGAA